MNYKSVAVNIALAGSSATQITLYPVSSLSRGSFGAQAIFCIHTSLTCDVNELFLSKEIISRLLYEMVLYTYAHMYKLVLDILAV